jgi:hypothetical protein
METVGPARPFLLLKENSMSSQAGNTKAQAAAGALFRPKAAEKADMTTQVANAIIADETAKRIAKTERLRAERLAHQADTPPAAPKARRTTKRARPA